MMAASWLVFACSFAAAALAGGVVWMFLERSAGRATLPAAPALLESRRLSTLALLARLLARLSATPRLRRLLAEADLDWSVGRLASFMLLAGAAVLALALRLDLVPPAASVALAAAAAYAPIAAIRRRRSIRMSKLEDQAPEALDALARALEAGHSLPAALEVAAEESRQPLARRAPQDRRRVPAGIAPR